MRLFDILYQYHQKYPKADCLVKKENGKWIPFSTLDFVDYSENLAYGLLALGVQREDKIALIANNRPEWNCADMGIQMSGAVSIPIYPTISETDLKFILNDAQVKFVFVSSEELFRKIKNISAEIQSIKEIYTFNNVPT